MAEAEETLRMGDKSRKRACSNVVYHVYDVQSSTVTRVEVNRQIDRLIWDNQ
jgi:hypothetical protein